MIPGSDRSIVARIYYPTANGKTTKSVSHGIWKIRASADNTPLAPQKDPYPLVVFSHGWQGDRFGNSWIAEALVDAGYIVAMIDHTHNTSYEHSDEFVYTSVWQRPLDLSALLDHLLQHPTWSQCIDKNKIAAGGFSLGGLTALWLTGIEGDVNAFKDAMQRYARWADWPVSVKKRASSVDWTKATRSYYDPRIKAVFAMAPDLGKGFTPEGLKKAQIPVLLIVGDQDTITPAQINAEFYGSHIKGAELLTIKKTGHYTFLNTCSSVGRAITPHLCNDAGSVSRAIAHEKAAARIKTFLKAKLNVEPGAALTAAE